MDPQTEKDDVSHKLIGAILAGDPKNEALSIVESLRPEQLTIVRDSQGMTPLHAATRMLNVSLVHALLDKCPDMADVASRADRNPAHWTPLMTLADMGKRTHSGSGSADDRRSEIIAAALVGNMTRDGLNNRAANWATVSHLATSRGHVQVERVGWLQCRAGPLEFGQCARILVNLNGFCSAEALQLHFPPAFSCL